MNEDFGGFSNFLFTSLGAGIAILLLILWAVGNVNVLRGIAVMGIVLILIGIVLVKRGNI